MEEIMCGILGFAAITGKPRDSLLFEAALRLLAHRGPDAEGIVGWDAAGYCHHGRGANCDFTLALGHRRLSILDLSAAGLQPMISPQGCWITYNGEVYNYVELRAELMKLGHTFSSTSDTEVILAAYAQWGTECVTRFNGMWAFAIYDPAKKGLFWSRDRIGVKPFYYTHKNGAACFASEVHALFRLLEERPKVDRTQLAKYVVLGMSDDDESSLYQDLRELSPGHCAWLDLGSGELRHWRYWSLPQGPDLELSDEAALDQFSEILEDAVRLRMRCDVPWALTLSGGVDSSALAVAASRVSDGHVTTYTSAFSDHPNIDETAYARQVVDACQFDSVYIRPVIEHLIEEEPLLTWHQAGPYGTLSIYVHWAILKEIKRHGIPVVISGQGGDELFLGYERYHAMHCLSQFPHLFRMARSAMEAGANSDLGPVKIFAYMAYFGNQRLRRWYLLRRTRSVYHDDLLAATPQCPASFTSPRLRELQEQTICGEQIRHLLRYDDRNAGAQGMETRLPFLDYRLVEFAYRLPWKFKIRDGWTKYLVRLYLDRHLLGTIAWRKRKLGFEAPNEVWTEQLIRCRGERLMATPFRSTLLRPDVSLNELPQQQRWDAYHILHLADIMEWERDWL
jgi:asparagine synthase (glutamine-hydrolysing)